MEPTDPVFVSEQNLSDICVKQNEFPWLMHIPNNQLYFHTNQLKLSSASLSSIIYGRLAMYILASRGTTY